GYIPLGTKTVNTSSCVTGARFIPGGVNPNPGHNASLIPDQNASPNPDQNANPNPSQDANQIVGVFYSPQKLLESNPVLEDFLKFPFDRICQYFRVIQKYGLL